MSEIKARFAQKHDVEANWNKATNFIPKAGEIIIYDADVNYSYPRIKVGDGTTKVSDLPFANSPESEWLIMNVRMDMEAVAPNTYVGSVLDLDEKIATAIQENPERVMVYAKAYINGVENDPIGFLEFKGITMFRIGDSIFPILVYQGLALGDEYTMTLDPENLTCIFQCIPWDNTSYFTIKINDFDAQAVLAGEAQGILDDLDKRALSDPSRVVFNFNKELVCSFAQILSLPENQKLAFYTSKVPLLFANMDGGEQSYPISDITVTVDLSSGAWEAKPTTISVATEPTPIEGDDSEHAIVMTYPTDFNALKYSEKVTINPTHGRISAQALVVPPDSGSPDQTAINIDSRGIIVEAGNTKSLGSQNAPWDHVYAATFVADDGHGTGRFIGDLEGTATHATADAQGRNIVNTYATKEEVFITTDDIDTICGTTIEVATSEVKF